MLTIYLVETGCDDGCGRVEAAFSESDTAERACHAIDGAKIRPIIVDELRDQLLSYPSQMLLELTIERDSGRIVHGPRKATSFCAQPGVQRIYSDWQLLEKLDICTWASSYDELYRKAEVIRQQYLKDQSK
jgi:hypothetical protein